MNHLPKEIIIKEKEKSIAYQVGKCLELNKDEGYIVNEVKSILGVETTILQ